MVGRFVVLGFWFWVGMFLVFSFWFGVGGGEVVGG